MYHFVYEIENIVTNKRYIGITNNAKRRKTRHFSELRNNSHCNLKLQRSFNKHGESSFQFKILDELDCERSYILELEKEYISKYNSYKDGYNLNAGGLENNGFESKLNKNDIMNILSVIKYNTRSGEILSDIFEVSRTTISRIKNEKSHLDYKILFDNFTENQKYDMYVNFCEKYDIEFKIAKSNSINSNRKFSEDEIFHVLSVCEFDTRKIKQISEYYNVSDRTIMSIQNESSYKDFCLEYEKLSNSEKLKIFDKSCELYNLENKNFNRKYDEEVIIESLVLLKELRFTPKEVMNVLPIENIKTLQRLQKNEIYCDLLEVYSLLTHKEIDDLIIKLFNKYKMTDIKLSSANKLVIGEVFQILQLLEYGGLSEMKIANKFSVPRGSIQKIKQRKSYSSAINLYDKLKTLNLIASSYRNIC